MAYTASHRPQGWRDVTLTEAHDEVLTLMTQRGFGRQDRKGREIVQNAFRMASVKHMPTVDDLAHSFYVGRKSLGRMCHKRLMPTPRRILAFARILNVTVHYIPGGTSRDACAAVGYDENAFSKAVHRHTGLRPTVLRSAGGGWIRLTQAWMEAETSAGRASFTEPWRAQCPACGSVL